MSGSQIRKIEAGDRTPDRTLVEAIEDVSELACGGAVVQLFDIVADRLSKNGAYPGWFADWLAKESQAAKLRWFEPLVVPGLLQTEAYARALLGDRTGFNGDVDEAVSARLDRQAILERDDPVELFAVIDEAVLHRQVGGPQVMAAQLKHLTDPPGRTILRVIPASTGVHDGLQGAFILADFADGTAAAYLETGLRGLTVEGTEDVAALAGTWERLTAEALPRQASIQLIQEVQETWSK